MLSLTEALIYLMTHPTAQLSISEREIESIRTDPSGTRPDRAWPSGSHLSMIERDGVWEVSMSFGPFNGQGRMVFDFSQIPHEEVGGRWSVETQDVAFEQ